MTSYSKIGKQRRDKAYEGGFKHYNIRFNYDAVHTSINSTQTFD